MTTATALTIERFAELTDAYGGDIERWPEALRAPAQATLAGPEQDAADELLREASALDGALDIAFGAPQQPSEALLARVLADAAAAQAAFPPVQRPLDPRPLAPPRAARRRDRKGGARSGVERVRSVPLRSSSQETRRVASIFAVAAVAGLSMGLFVEPPVQATRAGGAKMAASNAPDDPMAALMLVEFDSGFEDFLDG